jgi:two-component system response regulator FixJ
MAPTAKVYVVDDDPAVGDSLRFLLKSVGREAEVFASAEQFLAHYDPERSDAWSGRSYARNEWLELQEELQRRGWILPIVILTAHGDVPAVARAFKNGALEVLQKPCSDQELLDAVNKALRYDLKSRQERTRLQAIACRLETLSRRELEVLRLIVAGLSSREIAQRLRIQSKTVESHRMKIMHKLQAKNVADLVRQVTELAHSPWFAQWRSLLTE